MVADKKKGVQQQKEKHVSQKGEVTPTFKSVSQSLLLVTSSSLPSITEALHGNLWRIERAYIRLLELVLGLNKQTNQPGSQ